MIENKVNLVLNLSLLVYNMSMIKTCKHCIYGTIPSQKLELEEKSIIFLEGQTIDQIYSITSGYVKMSKFLDNGDEFIIGVLGPGDYIGLLALLQNKLEYIASSTCLTEVSLNVLNKDDVLKTYHSNHMFKELCLNCAITRSNLFHQQLLLSASTDVKDKILLILKNLSSKFGYIKGKQIMIDLPFSKTVLANIINIRRETLSRYLSILQKEKVIIVNRNQYILNYVI